VDDGNFRRKAFHIWQARTGSTVPPLPLSKSGKACISISRAHSLSASPRCDRATTSFSTIVGVMLRLAQLTKEYISLNTRKARRRRRRLPTPNTAGAHLETAGIGSVEVSLPRTWHGKTPTQNGMYRLFQARDRSSCVKANFEGTVRFYCGIT